MVPLHVCPRAFHFAIYSSRSARSFSHSASYRKASPLFHNSVRADTGSSNEHGEKKVLRMLIFGKPGAGKGTLSARLVKNFNILTLSTGDLLRQHIADRTEVGRLADSIVAQGGLLPDDVMLKVVSSKLDVLDNKHWILDGFPRTLDQGKLLDTHLQKRNTPLSLVVHLDVPDDVILGRITDRWIHPSSGRVYNLSYNRPKVAGYDDETGEPLIKRPDDNPDVFARRLTQFYVNTSPLLSYYGSSSTTRLVSLRGETSDEIWPKLEALVRGSFPNLRESSTAKKRHGLGNVFLTNENMATTQK